MARQFFAGPTLSPPASLVIASPGPHAGLSRLPEVRGRFDVSQVWAGSLPQQQQPVFRDNAMQDPWASEFSGALNQAAPGPPVQQLAQQIPDGMYGLLASTQSLSFS